MNVHHRCMPLIANTCGMSFVEPYGRMHLKITSEETDVKGTFCVTITGMYVCQYMFRLHHSSSYYIVIMYECMHVYVL